MPDAPAPESVDPIVKRAMATAALAKSQAEARKASADADSAEASARTALGKSTIGEIPSAPFSGAVTAAEGAALAEHNRLARRLLENVSSKVAKRLEAVVKGTNVYLITNEAGPAVAAAESYAMQRAIVERALADAVGLSQSLDAPSADDVQDALPVIAAVGLILSGLNAGLSYLRSDQTLGGRTFSIESQALLVGTASHLLKANKVIWVDLPPVVPQSVIDGLIGELAALATVAADARLRAGHHAARIAALTPKPAVASPAPPSPAPNPKSGISTASDSAKVSAPTDPDPKLERPRHEAALQALNGALSLFDEFQTALFASADGVTGLQKVGRARILQSFLKAPGACFAIVKLEGAFGSTLSTKNVLSTVFGSIPYKLSVQIQASWRCFSGEDSRLIGAGLEDEYMPFTKVDDIS